MLALISALGISIVANDIRPLLGYNQPRTSNVLGQTYE